MKNHTLLVALVLHAIIVGGALVFVGLQIRQTSLPRAAAPLGSPASPAGQKPMPPPRSFDTSKMKTSLEGDFVYGSRDAGISLITYMDYECPYCSKFYPVAKQLVDRSDGRVNLVLRQYPLAFHPSADDLSRAALCAAEQKGNDAFWAFSDRAFAHGKFSGGAAAFIDPVIPAMKLDAARLKECMVSGKVSATIRASVDEAAAIGIDGTPTSVLFRHATRGASVIVGVKPLDALQAAVAALK